MVSAAEVDDGDVCFCECFCVCVSGRMVDSVGSMSDGNDCVHNKYSTVVYAVLYAFIQHQYSTVQ